MTHTCGPFGKSSFLVLLSRNAIFFLYTYTQFSKEAVTVYKHEMNKLTLNIARTGSSLINGAFSDIIRKLK